ncbi:MAG: RluA family pseudouridine synthase [Zymomonas mobilis subsp. pomaceae]|uniref:RluA family pseudouridine synthase n=1 Tax=Zymomonas mobilis TaxID=542 RepID=UPI0039E99493
MPTEKVTLTEEMIGWRLDRALASVLNRLSRERLKNLIATGCVTNSQGILIRDPAFKIKTVDSFTIDIPLPRPAHNEAQDIPLNIVFEDDHLLIVNKPAGMVVHPAAGNFDNTLVNALLHHCAGKLSGIGGVARPGIVHRIDKDTSGLLVVAKTDPAHAGLAAQFAKHSIDRRYQAIVVGRPSLQGHIDASLARSSVNRQKMAIVAEGRGKHAVTHYRMVTPLKEAALIECRLETGRTHQVRVHMASIGHSLLGDPVYGRSKKAHHALLKELAFQRQALHAAHLGFIHPILGKQVDFNAEMPQDMQLLFKMLMVS